MKFHVLPGSRMDDSQNPGMQRLPPKLIGTLRRSVDLVAEKRMADARHMDPDLVRPPCLQTALHISKLPEPL